MNIQDKKMKSELPNELREKRCLRPFFICFPSSTHDYYYYDGVRTTQHNDQEQRRRKCDMKPPVTNAMDI